MTYAEKPLEEPAQTLVETAIAWGHDDDWIIAKHGVTTGDIDAVRAYLDAIILEPDEPHHGNVRTGAA